VPRLVLVFGDQLTTRVAALREADPSTDVVVMAEVVEEATYVRHHVRKLAFCFSAMRHFRDRLRRDGWTVDYTQLDADDAHNTIAGALLSAADRHGSTKVIATEPGEWRLLEALQSLPLKITILEDDRFVASHADFDSWAENRKELRMEWFYRDIRRKTGLLMEDGEPAAVSGTSTTTTASARPSARFLPAQCASCPTRSPKRCSPWSSCGFPTVLAR